MNRKVGRRFDILVEIVQATLLRRALVTVFALAMAIVSISGDPNPTVPGGTRKPAVYAGGLSTNSSNVLVPGYWKNGVWTALPPLDATKSSYVGSIVVSGSDVYGGGSCYNSLGVAVACYWKNGARIALPPLDPTKDSEVCSLVVSGSDVYAGGFSCNSTNVYIAGYWKNGVWTAFSSLDATKDSSVNSLVVVE